MSGLPAQRGVKKAREKMYRSLVIEAAEEVFAKLGYDNARIQDIAAEAGIALGTLYSVFPGKWEVYAAVHEARGAEVIEAVAASFGDRDASSPVEFLLDGVEAFVGFLIAHPSFLRMHLREGYSWAASTQFKSGEQRLAWQRGIDLMANLVAAGQADGSIVEGDPTLLAKTMAAIQQVQIADWVDRGKPDAPEALVARIQKLFQRILAPD